MSNVSSQLEGSDGRGAAEGRILDAALGLFARLGYHRVGMAEVAREAGVARATLYLRFRDKAALFDAVAGQMAERAIAAADAAWRDGASLQDNLLAAITAKDLPLYRLLHAGPHGAELMSVNAELTARHHEALDRRFSALLSAKAAPMGLDLSAFGGLEGFGALVATASAGLKHEARSEAAYLEALRRLVRVITRAAGAD